MRGLHRFRMYGPRALPCTTFDMPPFTHEDYDYPVPVRTMSFADLEQKHEKSPEKTEEPHKLRTAQGTPNPGMALITKIPPPPKSPTRARASHARHDGVQAGSSHVRADIKDPKMHAPQYPQDMLDQLHFMARFWPSALDTKHPRRDEK